MFSDPGIQTDCNVMFQNREEERAHLNRQGGERGRGKGGRKEGGREGESGTFRLEQLDTGCSCYVIRVNRFTYSSLAHTKVIKKKVNNLNCCQLVK